LPDVLVAEAKRPSRAVHRVCDDIRLAQVGKIELGMKRRAAPHVGDLRTGRKKVVVDRKVHSASLPDRFAPRSYGHVAGSTVDAGS